MLVTLLNHVQIDVSAVSTCLVKATEKGGEPDRILLSSCNLRHQQLLRQNPASAFISMSSLTKHTLEYYVQLRAT